MPISQRTVRALKRVSHDPKGAALFKVFSDQYSPANPDGVVCLGLAENSLMQDWLKDYFESSLVLEPNDFTYGDSLAGSLRLRTALAAFYATQIPLATPVLPSELVTSSGLSGFLDRVASAMCDAGEAILIPRPYYNAFVEDFGARSEVEVVGAGDEGVAGTLGEVEAVERELVRRERAGEAKVRAVLITNPHNPIGFCYPREVLVAYARLAQKHDLYLLVDEIYLASVFNPSPAVPFTSILSIDVQAEAGCDPKRVVHLYAASKDFGVNGFRVGVAVVRDEELYRGVMNGAFACKIGSPSDALWSALLNSAQLATYLDLNRARLLTAYSLVAAFLDSHAIPFSPASAGHFVMTDLSRFLLDSSGGDATVAALTQAELELMHAMIDQGVYVAPGTSYAMQKPGHFRLTFSLKREALVVGLRRLETVLGLSPSSVLDGP